MHCSLSKLWIVSAVAIFAALQLGCGPAEPASFKFNSVEKLKQEKLFLSSGESFDKKYTKEIGTIITALFGTPDDPQLPTLLSGDARFSSVVDQKNLSLAAGPVRRSNRRSAGLYRQHCAHCHGVSGDGAGPTAAQLNPYPRDFRLGKFKFKSTPLRSLPTDGDLKKTLINGVPGTAMPSFETLKSEDIDALIDYVKYLSARGQYERFLIAELANLYPDAPLIDLPAGRRWMAQLASQTANIDQTVDPTRDQTDATSQSSAMDDYLDSMFGLIGDGLVDNIVTPWVDAGQNQTEVPDPPAAFDVGHRDYFEFKNQGRKLFQARGSCAECHGKAADGQGRLESFDDWTNDWIKTPGVDPFKKNTYQPFINAGALPPRVIQPRNLTQNVYRGGGQPEDIYRRIANGIEGTPMPSAPTLSSNQIWALVAYVRSLPHQTGRNTGHRAAQPPTSPVPPAVR